MKSEEDEEEIEIEYEEYKYICDLLKEVLDTVVKVGNYRTMVEIEHLLDEREEYARQRDFTREINRIIRESDAFEVIEDEASEEAGTRREMKK